MSYMFSGMKLTSIDLSKINTEGVVSMAGLFKDSQALKSLDLSKFDTQNVEDMSSMFENCYSLTSIKFPGGLVTKKVKKILTQANQQINQDHPN